MFISTSKPLLIIFTKKGIMSLVCESAENKEIYKWERMCTNVKFNDENAINIALLP